jgi:DNA-binding PadR family transcriptional regulator
MAPALTPTSYAILGLLAVKPWTTYELAQQMDRSLGRFWPRAESKLYEEPKKLVERGLARGSLQMLGKRRSTVYSITPKGRRALAEWVPTPGSGPVLEFEQLIKVFFAEHATKTDLAATLADVRRWSEQSLATGAALSETYLAGEGPFPERLPWLVLAAQFLTDFYVMVGRWAEWAGDLVEGWPDDLTTAEPDWRALEAQAAAARTYATAPARDAQPD